MDIRELIDTLNNVVDKDAEVMVKVGDTFTGISHINIGSAGILMHVGTGEVTPIPEPESPLSQFKSGDRINVGANPNYSPEGPGTLIGEPTFEGNGIWWEFNSETSRGNWWVREDMFTLAPAESFDKPVLPEKITEKAQLDLDWPAGTRIATGEESYDLVYTRVDGEWRHDETWRPWGTRWCDCNRERVTQYVGEKYANGLVVLNLGTSDA